MRIRVWYAKWAAGVLVLAAFSMPSSAKTTFERIGEEAWPDLSEAEQAAALASADTSGERGAATVLTVGPGDGCTYGAPQDAIDAADAGDEVRLVSQTFTGTFAIFDKALTLSGGYPDCDLASEPSGRTTLDGAGSGPVLDIFAFSGANDPVESVIVENMVIRNGSGSGFPSGGVVVEGRPGRLEVSFRNVEISNNARTGTDDDGGGLRIVPTSDSVSGSLFGAMVSIDNDSAIFQNSAGGDGGGISCVSTFDHETNPITLLRLGTTLIANNEATNGGGIAIDGCRNVFLYSGGPFVLFVPTGGIISNTASFRGGGLYVTNGGEAFLGANEFAGFGDAEEAALLASNNADFGGGANVGGADSRLRIRDAYITGNTSGLFNGAISVGTSGSLVIDRLGASEACLEATSGGGVLSRPPCSIVADNTAQLVGAIGATTGAQVDVSRTIFRNNESTDGDSVSVIRATGVDTFPRTEVNVEGGLFYDNIGDRVFESNGRATMNVRFSTIIDNSNDIALVSGSSTNGNTTFDLAASIVGAASGEIIRLGGGPDEVASARCVIGDRPVNNSGFGSVTFYSDVDPEFRDRAMDDYRPGITSPALDYCDDAIAPAFVGLDGGERGVEWLGPNPTPDLGVAGGLFDLGAFEPPFTPPEIFSDRFEDMP